MDTEKRHRILVIEDDCDQRELIAEALGMPSSPEEAMDVTAVANAAEALEQDLVSFSAVLQDYHLPDMPGLELLRTILARVDLPVVIVTGQNDSATAAEALKCGAQDYVVKLGDYLFALPVLVSKNIRQHAMKLENQRLQRQLEDTLQQVQVQNRQLAESLQQVRTLATTDPLTGLANRRHFSEQLDRLYSEAVRYDFDLSCAMLDLDHYKQLNDALGHQVGDQLLAMASEVIQESLRGSDLAARYGGDEFVVLLPHTAVDDAHSVVERIREQLENRTKELIKGMPFGITASIGLASLAADGPGSGDALVAMADRALLTAKDRGKNCVVAFSRTSQPAG